MSFGKIAYGALFVIVLPLALIAWAVRLDALVALPAIASNVAGVALIAAGALLMAGGIVSLKKFGNGWPMSPYPPERRVSRGVYAIVENPIYAGAVLLSAGISIASGSAAGLWIVTPALALACIAFVVGYEREQTIARFGEPSVRPALRLPAGDDERPLLADRLSVYVLVLLPWLIAFYAANALAAGMLSRNGWTALDRFVPIVPWTEIVYALDYALVLAVPLAMRTRRQLREFAIDGWVAIASVTLVYLSVPVVVVPRDVPAGSIFTPLMLWERRLDTPATSFPAFHVVWAALAAAALARALPRLRVVWWIVAAAISISCITTGMHAVTDIVAAAIASALILSRREIVGLAISASQRIANSWREWDLGPIRFMTHGFYAAAGAFLGIVIVARLSGAVGTAMFVALCVIAGAGLWAQLIEGSPQLLRPFGYFGGVIGCCVGVAFTPEPWLILAAYAVAGPVIQAFGRCRCLVQGCCHGRPAPETIGIRYSHPRSRVTRLSTIAGEPLHPTQLYSIAWCAVMHVALLRLWAVSAPLPFICGGYFLLSGLGRFVEEHFRGEPQTPVVGGLHSYQWLSIASVIAGAVLTCVRGDAAPAMQPLGAAAIVAAALVAFVTYAAYGVDFPRLNARFARLV